MLSLLCEQLSTSRCCVYTCSKTQTQLNKRRRNKGQSYNFTPPVYFKSGDSLIFQGMIFFFKTKTTKISCRFPTSLSPALLFRLVRLFLSLPKVIDAKTRNRSVNIAIERENQLVFFQNAILIRKFTTYHHRLMIRREGPD